MENATKEFVSRKICLMGRIFHFYLSEIGMKRKKKYTDLRVCNIWYRGIAERMYKSV